MRLFAKLASVLLIGTLLLLLGTGLAPVNSSAQDVAVQIKNFAFDPTPLRITVGTTVTWTNEDGAPHSVVSSDGTFQSGILNRGDSFEFTFSTPGTFSYICGVHPSMRAAVIVTAEESDVQEFALIHSLRDLKIYPATITVRKDVKVRLFNTATDGAHPTVIISRDAAGAEPVFDVRSFEVESETLTTVEFTPDATGEFFITHQLHGHNITAKLIVED